jgi:hypothetical protein
MPINDLMGPLPETLEEFEEADAGWDALPLAVRRIAVQQSNVSGSEKGWRGKSGTRF